MVIQQIAYWYLSQTIPYENFTWKSFSRVSNNIGLCNNHFINLLRIIDRAWRELLICRCWAQRASICFRRFANWSANTKLRFHDEFMQLWFVRCLYIKLSSRPRHPCLRHQPYGDIRYNGCTPRESCARSCCKLLQPLCQGKREQFREKCNQHCVKESAWSIRVQFRVDRTNLFRESRPRPAWSILFNTVEFDARVPGTIRNNSRFRE